MSSLVARSVGSFSLVCKRSHAKEASETHLNLMAPSSRTGSYSNLETVQSPRALNASLSHTGRLKVAQASVEGVGASTGEEESDTARLERLLMHPDLRSSMHRYRGAPPVWNAPAYTMTLYASLKEAQALLGSPGESSAETEQQGSLPAPHLLCCTDEDGVVQGVLTQKDIGRALAAGGSLADHLSRWASPAVTIPHAGFSAQAAAGVMLAYRVKALPVVDDAGRALGLITSDSLVPAMLGAGNGAAAAAAAAGRASTERSSRQDAGGYYTDRPSAVDMGRVIPLSPLLTQGPPRDLRARFAEIAAGSSAQVSVEAPTVGSTVGSVTNTCSSAAPAAGPAPVPQADKLASPAPAAPAAAAATTTAAAAAVAAATAAVPGPAKAAPAAGAAPAGPAAAPAPAPMTGPAPTGVGASSASASATAWSLSSVDSGANLPLPLDPQFVNGAWEVVETITNIAGLVTGVDTGVASAAMSGAGHAAAGSAAAAAAAGGLGGAAAALQGAMSAVSNSPAAKVMADLVRTGPVGDMLRQGAVTTALGVAAPTALRYLYDGDCSICRTLQAVVEKVDAGKGYVAFTDIGDTATAHAERMAAAATAAATSAGAGAVGQQVAAAAAEASASVSPGVSASQLGLPEGVIAASHLPAPEMWASLGFSRQQALDVLHVVSASGQVIKGFPAVLRMLSVANGGGAVEVLIAGLPILIPLAGLAFDYVSKHRHELAGHWANFLRVTKFDERVFGHTVLPPHYFKDQPQPQPAFAFASAQHGHSQGHGQQQGQGRRTGDGMVAHAVYDGEYGASGHATISTGSQSSMAASGGLMQGGLTGLPPRSFSSHHGHRHGHASRH